MGTHLYKGKDWDSARAALGFGRIDRVATTTFCEMGRCSNLAAWRIGYGSQTVDFCAGHTLKTMRNTRLWTGRA